MAKIHFVLAEAFRPGEYLREELAARAWKQGDFAKILGRSIQVVNEIIKRINVETAKSIGLALGTGPELWLNLNNAVSSSNDGTARPRHRQASGSHGVIFPESTLTKGFRHNLNLSASSAA